ncbi:ClbS/DfsB family four-helix bundle protein [Agromyces sp. G08B096]|uniref:ClbS/DfsB family four-helix bundle protein n=1 Tax=Agromyces sp. G08B096 TaxID=3156399 RepID=A0AAU7WB33_9MICO
MSTPTTRAALEAAAVRGFRELDTRIESIPEPARSAPFAPRAEPSASAPPRDRDLQDVVNHLHAWHLLLLGWLDADAAGTTVAYPAEGFTWDALEVLNLELRDRHRIDSRRAASALAKARDRLRASHVDVLTRLEALSDADLFEPGGRAWLGGPLAEPVHECLGGHYAWAVDAIEAARA